MIRLGLVLIISLALNIGTYFAADLTEEEYSTCEICLAIGEPITERGFPIAYAEEVIDEGVDRNGEEFTRELFSSFNWTAFVVNWLVWFGVVSLLYFAATAILKNLGKTAFLIYLAATALGYSVSVGTWF